jgi:hypothetical protein
LCSATLMPYSALRCFTAQPFRRGPAREYRGPTESYPPRQQGQVPQPRVAAACGLGYRDHRRRPKAPGRKGR